MPVSDYLNNDKIYFAHIDGKEKDESFRKAETIEEHSSLALCYAKRIIAVQKLKPIIENIGELFFAKDSDNFKLWKKMFLDVIYLHDLGKANTDFQALKMKNKEFKDSQNKKPEHSISSASLYFSKYYEHINNLEDKKIFFLFLLINSFIIAKHHGYLNCFYNFLEKFSDTDTFFNIYAKLLPDILLDFSIMNDSLKIKKRSRFAKSELEKFEDIKPYKTADLYIYAKLLYSLLVSSDFYATSEYKNGYKPQTPEDFGLITDINKYLEPFSKTNIYKNIKKYASNRKTNNFTDINELRSELFIEAEENLLKNIDKNMFYLEAPTGSGKTNTAINLSLQIVKNCPDINKIFYVFPFNTLVEQTKNTLLKSFGENSTIGNDIGIINSLTPIYEEDEKTGKAKNTENFSLSNNNCIDYNQILMGRQFLHYPIIVTTHVKLFDWLFGVGRESHFPLCQLANSVIILDEIQSYKNSIWKEIAIFLNKYSKLLNIKIIIMSATLPKIGALIPKQNETYNENIFCNLISDRKKYFENKLFRDRVTPNFELLNKFANLNEDEKIHQLQEKIFDEYQKGKDILVEFITKKRSLSFFNDFKERYQNRIATDKLYLLNGDDNIYTRNKIISEVKNKDRNGNIILFSTQVIEAGVDIDLDVGFKDISILDSEEQFMGRINRSCKKSDCSVYFFNLDNKSIYKEDMRIEFTLENEIIQESLKNKDFDTYYKLVLQKIEKFSRKNTSDNIEDFRKDVLQQLNFPEIQKRLKLLKDDNSYTIFLNRTLKLDNNKELTGKEIWQKYKNLLNNFKIGYAEKQIELSKIYKEVSYFTYSVRKLTQNYNDAIGDIYYYENGEDFITEDGKFNREKFKDEKTDYEIL